MDERRLAEIIRDGINEALAEERKTVGPQLQELAARAERAEAAQKRAEETAALWQFNCEKATANRLSTAERLLRAEAALARVRDLTVDDYGHQMHDTKRVSVGDLLAALDGTEEQRPADDVDDLLYSAWAVIANAGNPLGDWDSLPTEWSEAARRWRDRWHARLDAQRSERSEEPKSIFDEAEEEAPAPPERSGRPVTIVITNRPPVPSGTGEQPEEYREPVEDLYREVTEEHS